MQQRRVGPSLSWGLSLVAAALTPIVFTVVASVGIIEANEIAPDSALAEASTLWMVTVLVGAFLVVPALVVIYGLRDPTPQSQVVTDGDVLPRLSVAG